MLASKMASVSYIPKSNIVYQASATSPIVIVRMTKLPRRCRYQQQARSFRIGFWSSYLDPIFQKELQRRHRVIKHKHVEALNRKLSWDRRLPVYATRWGLKGLMCSSWRAHDPRPGGRWVNIDEVKEVKENFKTTASCGIEEVEQEALNDLFGLRNTHRSICHDKSYGWDKAAYNSTLANQGGMRHEKERESRPSREAGSRHDRPQAREAENLTYEQEYIIDPITNRKVFGKIKSHPETNSQSSESHVTDIPVKTFKNYRSQFSQSQTPNERTGEKIIHLSGGEPSSAANSQQPPTSNVQDEIEKYKPFKYHEPDGKFPNQGDVTGELREHDHLYKPFKYNEPDGKVPEKPDCITQCLSDFDHQYKPFKYNEPDGEYPKEYDVIDYDRRLDPEPRVPVTRSTYLDGKKSHNASDSNQDSWLSQGGFSPGAILGREHREAKPRTSSQLTEVEPSVKGPTKSRPFTLDQVGADKYEDLDLLRASDIRSASGILKAPIKETQVERDQRRAALEKDFAQIQVRASSLTEEIAASQKVKKSRQLAQNFELERSYLLNHNAHARGRVNAKIAELDAEEAAEKAHLDAQKKITGNFIRDFPEEFSTSWSNKGSSSNSCLVPKNGTDAWGFDKSPKGLEVSYLQEVENDVQSTENDCTTDVASQDGLESTKLETALHRSLKASKNKAQTEHDPYTKEPQGLETSYAKEVQEQGDCGSPLFVKSYGCEKKAQNDKELVRNIRDIYESRYGTIDCKHRQVQQKHEEQEIFREEDKNEKIQRNIQNLEQSIRESQYQIQQYYMDIAKALVRQAAAKREDVAVKPESTPSMKEPPTATSPAVPTLYKVLSYDPTMKTIEMAETTSIANAASSALTPAQVLLRLSHPARFFPYFQPLQSQGFEIASGNGNVLVFRKVREGVPNVSPILSSRKAVNPIDGMHSMPQPAAGNFASPTGFVNHDLPTDHTFISGIDVRREEPVFSGRRTEWQNGDGIKEPSEDRSKKVGRGLLIGAAWVAACSYAVGVVAEYFTTGGSDGKGPVGF